MKGTGAGWDSILYRVFIVGGLVGIVAVTIGTVIFFDPQGATMLPVYTGGGCATLFLLGILAYWWWQLLFADYGVGKVALEEQGAGLPEIAALKSWTRLFESMVVWGGVPALLEADRRSVRRALLEWFGWATVVALYPIVNVWLNLFGVLTQETFLLLVKQGYVALIVLVIVRTYFLLKGSNRSDEEAIYAPLGLKLVEATPSRSGPKTLEGQRHEHIVRILVDGRHSLTHVSGSLPAFRVESRNGKFLLPEELPAQAHTALKDLRKAKRWVGVKLEGGPQGMVVEREARGMNLWLYDLWLAEQILEAKP